MRYLILIMLLAVIGCSQTATSETDEPLPLAVEVMSVEYQEAYRLLPNGPAATAYYARGFEDFDLAQWQALDDITPTDVDLSGYKIPPNLPPETRHFLETGRELWKLSAKDRAIRIHELQVCAYVMQHVAGINTLIDVIQNGRCDVAKVVEAARQSDHTTPTEAQYLGWLEVDDELVRDSVANKIRAGLR